MLLEAYLAYSLIPLFFIVLGFLVYLVMRYSHTPEAEQQTMTAGQTNTARRANSDEHQSR
ncbi:hypothetical protein KDH_68280 [Dictyobacter sp. S3.2.2.5]|uniref:Uncharacterized protein n=1 Tax=Dictyobacter halimunensis TaxID=3026934 RepID=A0ABQ6G0H6_9CHLR|nr:hypothetical protein KDH_68280 [Dictyobacter sp. S3.2.2.5]